MRYYSKNRLNSLAAGLASSFPYLLIGLYLNVNAKDCGFIKLHSHLFELPLEILKIDWLNWSDLNIWLVWRMRPLLRSGREDTNPPELSVLG